LAKLTGVGGQVKVAIIGAGAIGGSLAEAAAAAGHDVLLCVRSAIPRLEVEEAGSVRQVPVRISADPARETPADWVLLATKAQDTRSAAPWLERLTGPASTLVVLQNGIEHEDRVRALVGEAPVVPAIVYIAAERIGPGRVVHHAGNRVIVPQGERGASFARLLDGGPIEIRQEADFTTAAWRKLLSNVAANPITALTMRRIGVMREPAIRELARDLLLETAAVGRSAGARLTDNDVEEMLTMYASLNQEGGSSMLYDRLAGRPLEHEYITGAVVRAAERHGVPVPLNKAILGLLDALNEGLRGKAIG
jgi:2-dehydropantoate 2-reductase